jgi:ABC-type glutathione transport system ATPase component
MNEATAVPTSPQDASRAISTSLVDQDEDFLLETRGLTKQFSGFFAVRDVNLRVRKGTIHALIGPNGAGKTTCLQRAPGIPHALQGGERFINGSGAWRGGVVNLRLDLRSLRGAKRRSNPYFLCRLMDCFAALAMTGLAV